MVNRILLRQMGINLEEVDKEVQEAVAAQSVDEFKGIYEESIKNFEVGSILKGKVLSVMGSQVFVDVGYKSEGIIPIDEFDKPSEIKSGEEIEVLLEAVEDDSGLIVLSKRKADRVRGWERIVTSHVEGDTVTGRVMRKIKGGLLVDIGVPVFLPASQIDIRRPGEIADWIGKEVTCKILKIDKERRNMVVCAAASSRRSAPRRRRPCSPRYNRARPARAWSRTSPTSARSWTWAGLTACCTSPT